MKKLARIVVIILILISLILGTIFLIKYLEKKEIDAKKQAITNFFNCVNEEKFEEMYELISNNSQKNISKEDFVKRNKNIYTGIGATNLKIEFLEIDNNQVKYKERMFTEAGEIEFENTVSVIKEIAKYKLDWDHNLIFPELKSDYKVRISTIPSIRGCILDRNGELLAYDGEVSEVGIVPGKLGENKEENIKKIAELLEISTDKINKLLSASYVKDDTFVPIKKISKTSNVKEKLLEISGVKISNADGRVYTLGEEAAHLIGYVQAVTAEDLEKHAGEGYTSKSMIGKTGIESIYEKELKGTDGSEIYIEDAEGNKVKTIIKQEQKDGANIKLTIDAILQEKFYNEMKNDKGFFVTMNSETGELLALVSTPSYNSNDFTLGMSTDKWNSLNNDENLPLYNRFKQSYAPGSTFKPIIAAIGLSEGVINDKTEFTYSGTSWQKDKKWGDYFITTLTAYPEAKNVRNAIIRSDNIFFAQLALKIGKDKLSNGLDKLGFNETIDLSISIKKSQYLNSGSSFSEAKIANTGYGQGDVLVNPIHMASIYSCFVNDGNMVKPYLIYDNGKREILKENVFSLDAINIVKAAMENVIESPNGTANDARIPGLEMIGKTGTAELKKDKEDTESGTLGWFNCITLNRENENLVIIGMVENVQNNMSGGSHYVISKIKNVLSK